MELVLTTGISRLALAVEDFLKNKVSGFLQKFKSWPLMWCIRVEYIANTASEPLYYRIYSK